MNCTFEIAQDNPCVNGCSGRGECQTGWCRCLPGYYGSDCSLSLDAGGKPQLLAGTGYQRRKRRPSIYVYELPPKYNTWWVSGVTAVRGQSTICLGKKLALLGGQAMDANACDL